MASSEEIAAALEVALEDIERVAAFFLTDPGNAWIQRDHRAAATTLRAHLSRLREEERFRNAALALGFVVDAARPDPAFADETAGGRALRDFHLAYRALEGR